MRASIFSIECQVGAAQTVDLAHVRIAIDGQYDRVSFGSAVALGTALERGGTMTAASG